MGLTKKERSAKEFIKPILARYNENYFPIAYGYEPIYSYRYKIDEQGNKKRTEISDTLNIDDNLDILCLSELTTIHKETKNPKTKDTLVEVYYRFKNDSDNKWKEFDTIQTNKGDILPLTSPHRVNIVGLVQYWDSEGNNWEDVHITVKPDNNKYMVSKCYLTVEDRGLEQLTIGRIVCYARHGESIKEKHADHIDGFSCNNHEGNLRSVTPAENDAYAKEQLRQQLIKMYQNWLFPYSTELTDQHAINWVTELKEKYDYHLDALGLSEVIKQLPSQGV